MAATLSGLGVAGAQTLDDYLMQIHDADGDKRLAAVQVLRIFPASDASVKALIETLKDKSDRVRLEAAFVLGQLAADPEQAVPALVETLGDPNIAIREAAANALGNFGADAAPALSKLESLLADPDSTARRDAIQGLSGFASVSPEARSLIADRLKDEAPYVRSGALAALSRLREMSRDYLPQFIVALADPSEQVRDAAAEAIGKLGAAGAPALQALVAASRLGQPGFSFYLGNAIHEVARKQAGSAVPLLIAALNDSENSVDGRVFAAQLLGGFGPQARIATPDLVKASNEGPERVRSAAADALAIVSPETLAAKGLASWVAMLGSEDIGSRGYASDILMRAGAKAIPPLLEVVRKEDTRDSLRASALSLLGMTGGSDREVLRVTMELAARADSPAVQDAAVDALGLLAGGLPTSKRGPAIEALTKAAGDPRLQGSALLALGNLGEKAAAAAPAIQETLQRILKNDPLDPMLAAFWLKPLGRIGTSDRAVVSLVIPLLSNPNLIVRNAAVEALGGMPLPEAVTALVNVLHDPRDEIRANAAAALGRILSTPTGRPYAADAVPALLEHVKDPTVWVRPAVIGALVRSGAPEAVRPVINAMNDSSREVRFQAVSGLQVLFRDPGGDWIKEAALPGLTHALDDSDRIVTFWAAVSLKFYGPAGAAALPALRRLLANADPAEASTFSDAIKAIEAKP
jgi:HEAT repeat protein